MSRGREWWLVALVAAVACAGIADHALRLPDEPRVAEIGRRMYVTGDLVVPSLGGKPFLEKPPLYWWLLTGVYAVVGVGDVSARLVSALAAVALVVLVFDLARRLADRRAGVFATIVLTTMFGVTTRLARCTVDPLLALWVFAGIWMLFVALFPSDERAIARPWAIVGVYVSAGLAFLTKGPIGPGLLFLLAGSMLALLRRGDILRPWRVHASGIAILALLCAAWPGMLYLRDPALFREFFVHNVVYRIAVPEDGYSGGHVRPWFYYLRVAPTALLPWLIVLPAAAHAVARRRLPDAWNGKAIGALMLVFPVGVAALSLAGTKRGLYLLPLFAPLACAVGAWLSAASARTLRPHGIDRVSERAALGILIVVGAGLFVAATVEAVAPATLVTGRAPWHAVFHVPWVFAPIGVAIGVIAVGRFALRGRTGRYGWPAFAAVSLALLVGATRLRYAVDDPGANLHRMTAELERRGALERPLVAFLVGEAGRAIVPFHTGHDVVDIRDATTLASHVDRGEAPFILALGSSLPRIDAVTRDRYRVVASWPIRRRRTYHLLAAAPPRQPTGVPE